METKQFLQSYPLTSLSPVYAGLEWPESDLATGGDWEQFFDICALRASGKVVGGLLLARKALGEGRLSLALDFNRVLDEGILEKVQSTMTLREDRLCSPIGWEWSRHVEQDGKVMEETRLSKSARESGDGYEVLDTGGRVTQRLPGNLALSWGLLEAVRRLPAEPGPALAFDLVDHFDQWKPGHELAYWKSETLLDGGKPGQPATLDCFEQKGYGILPAYYYRDQAGRLVFMVSGIEAYVWQPENKGVFFK